MAFGRRPIGALFAAALATVGGAPVSSAQAQENRSLAHRGDGPAPPVVRAVRATAAPALDGVLDEPVWARAEPASGFRRDVPGDGEAASERTEVRIAYTDEALYVGARMHQRDPSEISLLRGRRDSFGQTNDQFLVQIDSYHDHRTAFVFGVTPAGGRNDLVAPNDGMRGMDVGWDPVWAAATRVDSLGWVAEIRIPFSQLRFSDGTAPVWGVNFRRDILAAGEAVDWSWRPATETGWASGFGHLVGLENIERSGRAEILPYGVARAAFDERADPASPFDDGSALGATAGLDLKYGLAGGLTLDATVNPDFGQVEADPAVVNLTVFETFLEERRPFFVEGAGLFGFGGLEGLRFFHSRRVGRRPLLSAVGRGEHVDEPQATTIVGAAKLSGRTRSGWGVALLNATTRREEARVHDAGEVFRSPVDPRTNTTAVRLRRDMRAGDSYVGVIGTGVFRDVGEEEFVGLRDRALVGGFDFLHRFGRRTYALQGWAGASRVHGDPTAMARVQRSSARYYQRPDQGYVSLDGERTSLAGYAGELAFRKEAGEWLYGIEGAAISPGFEMNDAGYQTVADVLSLVASGTRRWTRPGSRFRSANVGVTVSERRNFGGVPTHRGVVVGGNGLTTGFRALRAVARYEPSTWDPRATRGGPAIRMPAGWGGFLSVGGDGRNRVSGGAAATWSADREGSRGWTLSPYLRGRGDGWFSWRVSPGFARSRSAAFYVAQGADSEAAATWGRRYVFARLDQASVNVTARVDVALTPSVTLQAHAQSLVASGDYEDFAWLRDPSAFDFERYGPAELQTVREGRDYEADPDGAGPAPALRFRDPDFRARSLQGNVVLRWEYQPGSTLFFVWSQDRAGRFSDPSVGRASDLGRLFSDPMRNVFLVKASYWLDF